MKINDKFVYIINLGDKENTNASDNLITKKLYQSGFKGACTNSNTICDNNNAKDKADLIIYWVGTNVSNMEDLFNDIVKYGHKAVVGCLPTSDNYRMLGLLMGEDLEESLDGTINRTMSYLNNDKKIEFNSFMNK